MLISDHCHRQLDGHAANRRAAAEIADYLQAIVEAEAGDGFVISPAFLPDSFDEFVHQVVPELQRRDIFRKEYAGRRLRDHLGLAMP